MIAKDELKIFVEFGQIHTENGACILPRIESRCIQQEPLTNCFNLTSTNYPFDNTLNVSIDITALTVKKSTTGFVGMAYSGGPQTRESKLEGVP